MAATMTLPQLAERLGVSSWAVYREAKIKGSVAGVPVFSVGRRLLVATSLVDELLGTNEARAS